MDIADEFAAVLGLENVSVEMHGARSFLRF